MCRGWGADNSVENWWKMPISHPKPDLYNINEQTKFGENPFIFTIIRNENTYERTYERRTDGQTDSQRETIIPRQYRVAGYKNAHGTPLPICMILVLLCLSYFQAAPIFQQRIYFLTNFIFNSPKFQFSSTYHFNKKMGHTCLDCIHKISKKSKTGNRVFEH